MPHFQISCELVYFEDLVSDATFSDLSWSGIFLDLMCDGILSDLLWGAVLLDLVCNDTFSDLLRCELIVLIWCEVIWICCEIVGIWCEFDGFWIWYGFLVVNWDFSDPMRVRWFQMWCEFTLWIRCEIFRSCVAKYSRYCGKSGFDVILDSFWLILLWNIPHTFYAGIKDYSERFHYCCAHSTSYNFRQVSKQTKIFALCAISKKKK